MELAILRDAMSAAGRVVRWVPHPRMAADSMTKADPARGNVALLDLVTRGSLILVDEEGHLNERSHNAALKSRTREASRKAMSAEWAFDQPPSLLASRTLKFGELLADSYPPGLGGSGVLPFSSLPSRVLAPSPLAVCEQHSGRGSPLGATSSATGVVADFSW